MPLKSASRVEPRLFCNPNRRMRTNVAARISGLSPRMLRHLAQRGVLPAVRNGRRRWEFLASDVHKLVEFRTESAEVGIRPMYKSLFCNALACSVGTEFIRA
jgi:hypothetical protein